MMVWVYTFEDGTVLKLIDAGLTTAEICKLQELHHGGAVVIDLIERQATKEKTCSMCRLKGAENCDECEHPIDDIPSAQPDVPERNVGKWIPVRIRPMDSEEREYWEEHTGYILTDDMAQTFDSPMPDDGQRIWVQTKNGFVFDDVCDSDCDGIGLEGNGDWDDIVAWMPMFVPEPWKGEEDENG